MHAVARAQVDETVTCIERGEEMVKAKYIGLDDADMLPIAEAITKSTTLRVLSLRDNHIRCAGVEMLALAFEKSTSLKEVDLGNNFIEDVGATALARALASLEMIDLTQNHITDIGASALAVAIEKSTTIRDVRLKNNEISNGGAEALANAIEKSSSLQDISLSNNRVGDVGVIAIAAAIERSKTLLCFFLWGNDQITEVGAKALARSFERSNVLEYVIVDGPHERVMYDAMERAPHRRELMALACADGVPRGNPARKLLHSDGDHAIGTRVAQFLLE